MRSNTINTTLPSGEDTNYNILYDILKLKQTSNDYTEAHTHTGWVMGEVDELWLKQWTQLSGSFYISKPDDMLPLL